MLTKPARFGHGEHHGQIVGVGNWEPVLNEDTWATLKAVLQTPLAGPPKRAPAAATWARRWTGADLAAGRSPPRATDSGVRTSPGASHTAASNGAGDLRGRAH